MIKIKDFSWKIILDYPGEPKLIIQVIQSGEPFQEKVRERCDYVTVLALKVEEGSLGKGMWAAAINW